MEALTIANSIDARTSRKVTIYSTPENTGKEIGQLKNNSKLKVLDKAGSLYLIQQEDLHGYVPASSIKFTRAMQKILDSEYPFGISRKTEHATAKRVTTLREGPGANYRKLAVLQKSDEVDIILTDGNWAQIDWKDAIAYVKLSDLELS